MKTLRTKRLLIGILALIMVVSAVFVTLSFINTSSAKAEGEISFTDAGSKAAQNGLTRYLITVNTTADIVSNKDINFEVIKNGEKIGNIAFVLHRVDAGQVYFLINYAKLTGNNAITSASEITDTYIVTLKKDTAVGSYKVADDIIYKINRDSITLLNKITYTHSGASAQDHLTRYLVTVNASVDVGGSKDIGFEVTKNGESIGNKTFNIYKASSSSSYFLIDYGTLTGNNAITSASGVTDKYVVTLKKGTLVGNYIVKEDISYYFNGYTAKLYEELTYTHSSAGAQDGSTRYLITVNASVDVGSSKDIGFEVTKNGVSIGNKTFTIWRENASTSFFLINYGTLTGDNAITTASGVTDEYIVTLKKGTAVGNYFVKEDISYYITGGTVILFKGEITFTHGTAKSEDGELQRYRVDLTTGSADISVNDLTANFEVYKNGVLVGNKRFTIDRRWAGANKALFLIDYATLTDDAAVTTAAQITDTYLLTLKSGTMVNGYEVSTDISYLMCQSSITYLTGENNINVANAENGTVVADVVSSLAGKNVTLTITPNANYAITSLVIDGVEQDLLQIVDGQFTFLMPTSSVEVSASFSYTIAMINGAEIRMEEPSGLRFSFRFGVDYFNSLGEGATIGCLFALKTAVGEELIVAGNENVFEKAILEWESVFVETDGCVKANVSIYGIAKENYETQMVCRAFIKTADGDYIYSDVQVVRSVSEVANNALDSGDEFTPEQLDVLNEFANRVNEEF